MRLRSDQRLEHSIAMASPFISEGNTDDANGTYTRSSEAPLDEDTKRIEIGESGMITSGDGLCVVEIRNMETTS
jgi:hypothetical protein